MSVFQLYALSKIVWDATQVVDNNLQLLTYFLECSDQPVEVFCVTIPAERNEYLACAPTEREIGETI